MKTKIKNVQESDLAKLGFQTSYSTSYDENIFFKIIKGRVTKARYKALERFSRFNTKRIPVYSQYDCTGQLCGVYTDVVYGLNKILIKVRFSYDV